MPSAIEPMRGDSGLFSNISPKSAATQKSCRDDTPLQWANDQAHYLKVIASVFDDYCTDLPQEYSDETSSDEKTSSRCDQCRGCGLKDPLKPATSTSAQPKRGVCRKVRKGSNDSVENKETAPANQVHCVSRIEGPLMSLWPTPLEHLELEWSERFYE